MPESEFLRQLRAAEVANQHAAVRNLFEAAFSRRSRDLRKQEEYRRATEAIKSRQDFLDWYVRELDIETLMEDVKSYWGAGCPPLQRVNTKTHATFVEGFGRHPLSKTGYSTSQGYGYEVYGNGYLISGNEVSQAKAVGKSIDSSKYWDYVSPSFFLYAGILIDPDRSYHMFHNLLDDDNNPIRLVVMGDMGRSYHHIGKILGQRRNPSGSVQGHSWIADNIAAARNRLSSDPGNFPRLKSEFRQELAKIAASTNRPKF